MTLYCVMRCHRHLLWQFEVKLLNFTSKLFVLLVMRLFSIHQLLVVCIEISFVCMQVLIIGEEEFTPYSRPPLSKQLWLYEDAEATKQLKFKASWSGGKLVE